MDVSTLVNDYFTKYKAFTKGSISQSDGQFIAETLIESGATACLELGVASGLSTGLMLTVMEDVNPDFKLYSVDLSDRYYIDPSRPVGFLIETTNPQPRCRLELHLNRWAADLPEILGAERLDVAFIDAMHRHPWTLIDTMLTLPLLKDSGIIIFHDLWLFQKEPFQDGIGPHYVYYGINDYKWQSDLEHSSIGAIQFRHPLSHYENMFLDILSLDWTLNAPIAKHMVQACLKSLSKWYSADFVARVATAFERLNRAPTDAAPLLAPAKRLAS